MRHEHGHLPLVLDERLRDLLRGEDETARRVQDEVEGLLGLGQADRAENRLRVIDRDRLADRHAEEALRVLPMDHRDDPGFPFLLEPLDHSGPCRIGA